MNHKSIIMYACYELLRDKDGAAIDAICKECNIAYKNFYNIDPIGKRRSEWLNESNVMIINKMEKILKENTSDLFNYEEEPLGILDVIMEPHGDGKCVDVYTINTKQIRDVERKHNLNYMKYLHAVMLNGIAVWQWDIKEHRVYADNMLTDPRGDENVDMNREQIVWDEFDRLDYILPEDREYFKYMLYSIRDREVTSCRFNCRIIKDGKPCMCEFRAGVEHYDSNGHPEIVLATSRVIEEA